MLAAMTLLCVAYKLFFMSCQCDRDQVAYTAVKTWKPTSDLMKNVHGAFLCISTAASGVCP